MNYMNREDFDNECMCRKHRRERRECCRDNDYNNEYYTTDNDYNNYNSSDCCENNDHDYSNYNNRDYSNYNNGSYYSNSYNDDRDYNEYNRCNSSDDYDNRECCMNYESDYNNYNNNYHNDNYDNDNYDNDNDCCYKKYDECQRHVHEFLGSTRFAEENDERHNHRFAGVTGEAIRCGKSHVHKIKEENTDFFDHYHEICDVTGPAIPVGGGKHVHLVKGRTSCNDGHSHEYIFATLIEAPTVKECK